MQLNPTRMILTAAALVFFVGESFPGTAQQSTTNRNAGVKSEMKQSGKEAGKAGTSLGHNVKHGHLVRGGKRFGKHVSSAGKHFGKGSGRAAKKTGKAVKNAVKQ